MRQQKQRQEQIRQLNDIKNRNLYILLIKKHNQISDKMNDKHGHILPRENIGL